MYNFYSLEWIYFIGNDLTSTNNLCRTRSNVVEVAATLTEDQKKPGDVHHSFS